jgi:hypothetical protein
MKTKKDFSKKVYYQGELLFSIDQEINIISMKTWGSIPKESYPFPLMAKGGRNMRREISTVMS